MNETDESPFRTSLNLSDVRWDMDWSHKNADGTRKYPDKPEKETQFEASQALALLLINEVVYINNHWWEDSWPEKAKNTTSLNVSCNDVFAWGCTDSEMLYYGDIESLYDYWLKDPSWGTAVWCMLQRKQLPQDRWIFM